MLEETFRKRPRLSQLPLTLQCDMKALCGAYSRACDAADALLFGAGDAAAIDLACNRSTIGKLLPDDLYVHKSALDSLAPILRIYEGCGRAYLGEIEGANIIRIHRRSGKLSYLVYPAFETDPHPALLRCVKLNLRTRHKKGRTGPDMLCDLKRYRYHFAWHFLLAYADQSRRSAFSQGYFQTVCKVQAEYAVFRAGIHERQEVKG